MLHAPAAAAYSSRNSICQTMHKLRAARRHIRSHQQATNTTPGVPSTASYPQNHHLAPAANQRFPFEQDPAITALPG